jgi:hypothetical protein
VLLAPIGLRCASPDTDLQSGFRLLYELRFNEARGCFSSWRQAHPEDPMGHTAEAASHLFEEFEQHGVLTAEFFLDDRRFLGGITGKPDAARTRVFDDANQRARKLALQQLAVDPGNTNALLAMTMTTGMQADFASLIEKKQFESLRLIREAEAYGKRLLSAAPAMGDGNMAIGAASYIVACLPAYKRALLWVGGVRGEKQRGINQLAMAAKNGLYLRAFAKMLLALVLLREKQPARAGILMRELTEEFPQSPLFARERLKIDPVITAR